MAPDILAIHVNCQEAIGIHAQTPKRNIVGDREDCKFV